MSPAIDITKEQTHGALAFFFDGDLRLEGWPKLLINWCALREGSSDGRERDSHASLVTQVRPEFPSDLIEERKSVMILNTVQKDNWGIMNLE
jgi:hypothetical protein